MIKLTVEIKQDTLEYSYTVSENTHTSTRHLCAESFVLFSNLLQLCSRHYDYEDRKWEREIVAKAWLEKQAKETK